MEASSSEARRTIAFALSIVRSKPDDITIRDYLRLLRQHIAKGRRENALSSVYRHLDRSSYWRSEYERVRRTLKGVEDERIDLKRKVEELKGKLDESRPPTSSRKRRRPEAEKGAPSKKGKLPDSSLRTFNILDPTADYESGSLGEHGDALVRDLYQLHILSQDSADIDSASWCYYIVQIASDLAGLLEDAVGQKIGGRPVHNDDLGSTFDAAYRATSALLAAVSRLSETQQAQNISGHDVHAILELFDKLITLLKQSAARKQLRLSNPTIHISKKDALSRTQTKQLNPLTDNEDLASHLLTLLLRRMVEQLDPAIEPHQSLFEGFSYLTLQAIGPRLRTLVFGHPRAEILEEEIMTDAIMGGGATSNSNLPPEQQLQLDTAKLEAPYLIHLLQSIMSAAPAHFGTEVTKKTGKPMQSSRGGSTKGILTVVAKERLQRTLVNCIFGAEGVDQSDPFFDCLQLPALSAEAPLPVPKAKDAQVKEWFAEEVWRLLGWEILAREGPDLIDSRKRVI